jgi:hypothetical protein
MDRHFPQLLSFFTHPGVDHLGQLPGQVLNPQIQRTFRTRPCLPFVCH